MNEKIILKLVVFSIVLARPDSILPVIRGITLMKKNKYTEANQECAKDVSVFNLRYRCNRLISNTFYFFNNISNLPYKLVFIIKKIKLNVCKLLINFFWILYFIWKV
jgi:hypothetical protein